MVNPALKSFKLSTNNPLLQLVARKLDLGQSLAHNPRLLLLFPHPQLLVPFFPAPEQWILGGKIFRFLMTQRWVPGALCLVSQVKMLLGSKEPPGSRCWPCFWST